MRGFRVVKLKQKVACPFSPKQATCSVNLWKNYDPALMFLIFSSMHCRCSLDASKDF